MLFYHVNTINEYGQEPVTLQIMSHCDISYVLSFLYSIMEYGYGQEVGMMSYVLYLYDLHPF